MLLLLLLHVRLIRRSLSEWNVIVNLDEELHIFYCLSAKLLSVHFTHTLQALGWGLS